MLFCGCGPGGAAEREQWSLQDVPGIVLEHFGLGFGAGRDTRATGTGMRA
jgi:hypothetical protein